MEERLRLSYTYWGLNLEVSPGLISSMREIEKVKIETAYIFLLISVFP